MDELPYWAAVAVPGDEAAAALAEGRRLAALDLATRGNYYPLAEEALARAVQFEAYLKGEVVEDVNGAPLNG